MSYQTPPQFSGAPMQQPSREIDWGVISEGFNLLFKHWQVYVIPGIVILIASLPYFIVSMLPLLSVFSGGEPPGPFEGMGLQLALLGLQQFVSLLVEPGICLYTLNVVRGRPASSQDLWLGFRDPLGYIALGVLMMAAYVAGFIACCIGIVFVAGLLMFAIPIKADQQVTASEAMTQSWNMLKSQWLLAGVFYFVIGLISTLGQMACYIGIAITMPFLYIAPTLLYCKFMGIHTPQPEQHSASPYPRGGSYGQPIGQEQPRPPEQPPQPPTPEQ